MTNFQIYKLIHPGSMRGNKAGLPLEVLHRLEEVLIYQLRREEHQETKVKNNKRVLE